MAQRVGIGITLLYHDRGTRRGWVVSPGRTLPPGKTRYPFYRRLGGPQGRSGRAENLVPTWIRSRTVQPVVIRYTDWATRPTHYKIFKVKLLICWRYVIQVFSDVTSNWLQTAAQNIVNEDAFYTEWGKLPKRMCKNCVALFFKLSSPWPKTLQVACMTSFACTWESLPTRCNWKYSTLNARLSLTYIQPLSCARGVLSHPLLSRQPVCTEHASTIWRTQ